jgi:hypothetical protein
MRPPDLAARLRSQGWNYAGSEPGMVADLQSLPSTPGAAPPGLNVELVTTDEGLMRWAATLGQGFGEGPHEADWAGSVFRRLALDPESGWRHYLAGIGRETVGTASILLACGVAGLYFVSTVPAQRRQGIGAALTVTSLRSALADGYSVGVLQSSPLGEGLYRRLGFREVCKFELWEMR